MKVKNSFVRNLDIIYENTGLPENARINECISKKEYANYVSKAARLQRHLLVTTFFHIAE